MSVAKIIEITSSSTTSFDDAVEQGIAKANASVDNVRSAWIKDQQVLVDGGKITEYRVNLKITFVLK